jgi:hypothetical protein
MRDDIQRATLGSRQLVMTLLWVDYRHVKLTVRDAAGYCLLCLRAFHSVCRFEAVKTALFTAKSSFEITDSRD